MPRFFVGSEAISDGQVRITGNDAWHMAQVQRMKVGNVVEVFVPGNSGFSVRLVEITPDVVVGRIEGSLQANHEPPLALTLFQGIAKGDRMDFVMQKAVELGAANIVPFFSQHCVVELDTSKATKRQQRWQRIAEEAAKQCYRDDIPKVQEPMEFAQMVDVLRSGAYDFTLFPYERESRPVVSAVPAIPPETAAIIIGPEGGFSSSEAEQLIRAGATSVSLGPRILRTETAGIVALTMLGMLFGDLNREVGMGVED